MQWSVLFKSIVLAGVFALMFAFTRYAQDQGPLALWNRQPEQSGCMAPMPSPIGHNRGQWLSTRGRRLVNERGRRFRGLGVEWQQGAEGHLPASCGFVRLSAGDLLGPDHQTNASALGALVGQVDSLSHGGKLYVMVGLPAEELTWLWSARMAPVVHALADRPYVMFDLTHRPAANPAAEVDLERREVVARVLAVREAERAAGSREHILAIDGHALGDVAKPIAAGHRDPRALDYVANAEDLVALGHNVVTIGRRPAWALHAASALYLEPLRSRRPSVQPAT